MMNLLLALMALGAELPENRREAAAAASMQVHVLRLAPGEDLLASLTSYARRKQLRAGVVLTGVGSLKQTRLRFANRPGATDLGGKREIVSLVGMMDANGAHLHLSVSDGKGRTIGGHLLEGCKIYTTAEIAIVELQGVKFSREHDPASGYPELKIDVRNPSEN